MISRAKTAAAGDAREIVRVFVMTVVAFARLAEWHVHFMFLSGFDICQSHHFILDEAVGLPNKKTQLRDSDVKHFKKFKRGRHDLSSVILLNGAQTIPVDTIIEFSHIS
jgi:hypothetical protein